MGKKKTVAVFFGGCSSEYGISLQSAYGVLTHLDGEKYRVLPVGITAAGQWLLYGGLPERIPEDTWASDPAAVPVYLPLRRTWPGLLTAEGDFYPVDLALPVLHGRYGEDGCIQGLLEMAGIPVAGCGVLSSALCMDKHRAHLLAEKAGIDVPKGVTLRVEEVGNGDTEAAAGLTALTAGLTYPLFAKPLRAGSSYGITRVTEPALLPKAVEQAAAYDSEIIIEEEIPGFEVGCAVLEGRDGRLYLGRADEIELLTEGFFDYTRKYTEVDSRIHTPGRFDSETEARILNAARTVFRALGCSGLARVDMFLTPEGRIVLNEVNTIPGLTSHSRFPKMLEAAGISFSQMLDILLAG